MEKLEPTVISDRSAPENQEQHSYPLKPRVVQSEKTAIGSSDRSFERDSGKGLVEPANEDQYPHGFNFVLLTIGLMAVVLVVALDNYINATAIPRISADFKALDLVGWYGSSYFLALMAFQPAFGQLFTLFPIKTVYLISIVVFELGSIISASAPTSVPFIVGRLVSGAAGGGLWCGTLTLVGQAVPVRNRHLYVSIVTSMYGVASAAGPLLGGVFTDSSRLTWRFCFWVNLRT
ncbi:MAG: hypothetical protein MMC33_009142 [Icmadophila ericetorum]|nr:hypothetical protein [Icmadophila ericetorum]